jgi:hypothetical protein
VLASLLPGVRELRAPLASGYLWIAFIWALGRDDLRSLAKSPTTGRAGALHRFVELQPVFRGVGITIAASVVAYVLGSLMIALGNSALAPGISLARTRVVEASDSAQRRVARQIAGIPPAAQRVLTEWAEVEFEGLHSGVEFRVARQIYGRDSIRADDRPEIDRQLARVWRSEPPFTADGLVRQVLDHQALVKTQLLALTPGLHGVIDRRDSEATFRLALAAPVLALAAWLGTQASQPGWIWLSGTIVAALLLVHGLVLRGEATEAMALALRSTPKDETPSLAVVLDYQSKLYEAVKARSWVAVDGPGLSDADSSRRASEAHSSSIQPV